MSRIKVYNRFNLALEFEADSLQEVCDRIEVSPKVLGKHIAGQITHVKKYIVEADDNRFIMYNKLTRKRVETLLGWIIKHRESISIEKLRELLEYIDSSSVVQ